MNDSVTKRLQEHLDIQQTMMLSRTTSIGSVDHESVFSEHAQRTVEKSTLGLKNSAAFIAPLKNEGLLSEKTANARRDLQLEGILAGGMHANRVMELVIPSGSTIFAPPYDKEWSIGRGLAFGAKKDGKFVSIQPLSVGTSGAGVGLIVQSPSPAIASIRPVGTYSASILSVETLPLNSWSAGGLGITIYKGTNASPEISRLVKLWAVTNFHPWLGLNLEGSLADPTSINSVGMFPFRLGDFTLTMEPEVPYLVWIWSWQTCNIPDGLGFLALMNVSVPAVSLSAGSPLQIR